MASPVWGWRSHGNAPRSLSLRLQTRSKQVTSCRSQKAAFANRTRPKGVLFAKAAFCKQIATRDLSGGCGRLRALASLRSVIMGPPPPPSRGRGRRTTKNDGVRSAGGCSALCRAPAAAGGNHTPAGVACAPRVPPAGAGAGWRCSRLFGRRARSAPLQAGRMSVPQKSVRALDRTRRPLWPRSRAYGAQTITDTTPCPFRAYRGRPAPSRGKPKGTACGRALCAQSTPAQISGL